MIYLTGDTHGQFDRVYEFCRRVNTTSDDVMVVLDDVGFNYYLDDRDAYIKNVANNQPIKWFCLKSNHEKYAGALDTNVGRNAFGGV